MKCILLSLLLLIPFNLFAQKQAVVNVATAYFRTAPSKNAKIILTVKRGAKFKLLSPKHFQGWFLVSTHFSSGDVRGWIDGNQIEITVPEMKLDRLTHLDDPWVLVLSNDISEFWFNSMKTHRTGSSVAFWVKIIPRDKSSETYDLTQWEARCSDLTMRIAYKITYFKATGTVKDEKDWRDMPFDPAAPDSPSDLLVTKVCKNY